MKKVIKKLHVYTPKTNSQIVPVMPMRMEEARIPSEWWKDPEQTDALEKCCAILKAKARMLKDRSREGTELRALFDRTNGQRQKMLQAAKKLDPLRFTKVSYEQSLVLNSWIWGITFPMQFTSNRIGKTAVDIISAYLWVFPNNPNWRIFKPYTDHLGRKVEVFPRPPILHIKRIQRILSDHKKFPAELQLPDPSKPHYDDNNQKVLQWLQNTLPIDTYLSAYPDPSFNYGGTIWFCCQDNKKLKSDFFPELKRWLPSKSVLRFAPHDNEIVFETSPKHPKTVWQIIGKSYESEDDSFASGAVDIILLTEGVPPSKFKEVKLRFKDPGIGAWDYTPHEAINQGKRSKLAWDIYHGRVESPLRKHVFTKFSVRLAPDFIVPTDKRNDLIRTFENDPEGKARIDGEFYSSSGLVLSHLSRDIHLLSWSRAELFQRFPNARFIRGLDPGFDHPTACCWAALLPSNVYVVYRMLSERGLTISQRCERIVNLSGNKREFIPFRGNLNAPRGNEGNNPYSFRKERNGYWVETHPSPKSEIVTCTFTDYHLFKTDESTGRPYVTNYMQNGLILRESIHDSPEQRCQRLDDMLGPNEYIPHLQTNQPPAPQVYFLKNEPGIMSAFLLWEEYFWDRFKSGDKRGEPKDKVPDIQDDELDAVCYAVLSPIRWTSSAPRARLISGSEIDPEYENIEQYARETNPRLQSLQNQKVQVVTFGESEPDLTITTTNI